MSTHHIAPLAFTRHWVSALAGPTPITNALPVTAISIAMALISVEMAFIVCPLTNRGHPGVPTVDVRHEYIYLRHGSSMSLIIACFVLLWIQSLQRKSS